MGMGGKRDDDFALISPDARDIPLRCPLGSEAQEEQTLVQRQKSKVQG